MSDCTAKLCVWVTEFGDPCHIMQSETFYVHVTDCEGKVLEWCKNPYSYVPTKCGMVEIEVPPGCYSVFATHTKQQNQGIPPFGNHLTHIQVVRVNCGDHVCVTLFTPMLSHCGSWFLEALKRQQDGLGRGVEPRLIKDAVTAVEALVAKLPTNRLGTTVAELMQRDPPQ